MDHNTETIKILVVFEGSEVSRDIAKGLSEYPDLQLVVTESGADALELIKGSPIDAVVSGIVLADKTDGLEMLSAVRKFDHLLPYFIYTTEKSHDRVSSAFQAGANDYFVAEGTKRQYNAIYDAIKVSFELSTLLRRQLKDQRRSFFEQKYEDLFDELKEGSMMINSQSGMITFANEGLAHSIGLNPEDMINKRLDSFLVKGKGAISSWRDLMGRLENGEAVVQLSFSHLDGSVKTFWTNVRLLELSGSTVLLCQSRDVTRLEQLEHEISSVRNQLKVIVENSADAIILAREDGLIEFIGGSAPKLFGVSPDDMRIATIDDLFSVYSGEISQTLRRMGSRQRLIGVESHIVSRWGTHVPVSISVTRLASSDNVVRYLFNIMDITPQKVVDAEKLLVSELMRIVSTGAGPVEALPKLIQRVQGQVPINYGMVVSVDWKAELLRIDGVYNSEETGTIKVGHTLDTGYLPAEEELWIREGIVRNNLQEYGLHPLEEILYKEGVRSYISLPLMEDDTLVGGAHFGSHRAYALNRGHLALFREIAGALAGTLLRAKHSNAAHRYRQIASALAESCEYPLLICDEDGTVIETNQKALDALGATADVTGGMVMKVLRRLFPGIPVSDTWLRAGDENTFMVKDLEKKQWRILIRSVSQQGSRSGYFVQLYKM